MVDEPEGGVPPGSMPDPAGYSTPPPPPPGTPPPRAETPGPAAYSSPPPAAPVMPAARWYPLGGLATALNLLFVLTAVVSALSIAALVNRISLVNDALDNGIGFGFLSRAEEADDLVRAAVVMSGVLSLALLVMIIVWTWRATKNNETLGRRGARFSPGWTIAGWLIPLANLVIPVLVLQDLWRGSDPETIGDEYVWRQRPGSGLVGWYWTAFVLAFLRVSVGGGDGSRGVRSHLENVRTGDSVGAVGMVFAVIAALLGARVVRRISDRQEACRRVALTGAA